MKTVVITKVYEVRQSTKGGSWTYEMYFNKEKAIKASNHLNETFKEHKIKFRVIEHNCQDIIVYNED